MLWQKESSSDLYIDIFKNLRRPITLCRLKREKSNADALAARIEGNEMFKDKNFYGAMDKYNQSICFAENWSEGLSIAYANRSSCFEKLRKFSFCLIDIRLAKENGYPQHLMHKIDSRKQRCILELQSEETDQNKHILSYPADENIAGMANVLRIDINQQYGRLITSTQDIQISETILIEESFVRFVIGENIGCSNCGKKNANFVPCENCGGAMFCSKVCSKNVFHAIECEMLVDSNTCNNGNFFPVYVLRSIIIGLSVFTSASEVMSFVENCRSGDPYEIPHSTSTAVSKYRIFFNLAQFVPDQRSEQFVECRKMAYFVYRAIKSSSLGARFETKSHRRLLAHLIMHHIFILRTNSFGGFESHSAEINLAEKDKDYEQSIHLIASHFNHSCCPNVAIFRKGNLSICKAIQPIRSGDQLFISYMDEDDVQYQNEIERQSFLQNNFGFKCNCLICEKGILKNTFALQDDKSYVDVVNGLKELEKEFKLSTVKEIIENCEKFITKFATNTLSAEAMFIKHNLIAMVQLQIENSE